MVDLAAACGPGAVSVRLPDLTHVLPGGLEVLVVSRREQLGPALACLRAEAAAQATGSGAHHPHLGSVVGIDLEWRPDFRPGSNNPVALVQLAAGGCVRAGAYI